MPRLPLRPTWNSPVILSFAMAACAVMALDGLLGGRLMPAFFAVYPGFDFADPLCYLRLMTHAMGHRDWGHLTANFSVILLVGPILEEKYGSARLAWMMVATALVTGVLNAAFFSTGLLGASGLAFMMILLASFTNHKEGELPLTFVLVLVLFLSKEVAQAFSRDDVSQFAHIMGGVSGSLFGFLLGRRGR
ncbi:MAG TPA: rhomboid family intramembrane serine protease [Fibrobacteria bacterium]|nr:rhomboid family intramembrane serine protease [Fibrobacteria bacterium]